MDGARSALENFVAHTHFNCCSYMLWSLTTSKSGHQKGCQFVSTYLKSVKICNTHFYFISTLLLDHVLLKMDNRKY